MPPTSLPGIGRTNDNEKKMQQSYQDEIELRKLRREYLILDQNHTRIQQHGVSKLSKATKVFNIFKTEYKNILTNLSVATSPAREKEDNKVYDHLTSLVHSYSVYDKIVKSEKTYMAEVEEQIKTAQKVVQGLRKLVITDKHQEDRFLQAVKTLEALENKLELETTKFSVICAKNRQLRSEIDHHLWDRRNFMHMWDKLISRLVLGKQIMLDLIEQATLAYDQREDWCNKLQTLRMKAHNDLLAHIEDMRQLKRKEDQFKKLEDFYNIKGRKRIMRDLEIKEKQKRLELKEKLQEKLKHYKTMVDDITVFSQEQRTNVIAKNYCNQEERNFMYFNYINDLIGNMESVGDKLALLHIEIEDERTLQVQREKQQMGKLENLEKSLETARTEAEDAQAELNNLCSQLNNMTNGIERLFKICKCNSDPLLNLLGDNSSVKSYNILLFLEILERKVHEGLLEACLRDKVLVERKKISINQTIISMDDKIAAHIYPIEKIVPTNPCSLCVEHEMVSDVVDKAQTVWNRKEVELRLKDILALPDGKARVHSISRCHLPRARQLMQKRYE